SWVFKSFLKVERDAPALVVQGSSFHQRGTTNENSLDCRTCTDGSAKRCSLEERSILGVTFLLQQAGEKLSDFLRRLEQSLLRVVERGGLPPTCVDKA